MIKNSGRREIGEKRKKAAEEEGEPDPLLVLNLCLFLPICTY
jgi:hypothetical protein